MSEPNIVNIDSSSCPLACRRTVAMDHPSGVGHAPFGEVRRCEHGKYWFLPMEVLPGGLYIWQPLSRVDHPFIYRRARRAFREADAT